MAEPSTVTIADMQWPLKSLESPIPHLTDATSSVGRERRTRKLKDLIKAHETKTELAAVRGLDAPEMSNDIIALSTILIRENWEAVLEFLDIEDFPVGDAPTIEDFERAVQMYYGAKHDNGLSTFEDLGDVYETVSKAWGDQVEEGTDIPPTSKAASSGGQSSGPTKRPSKRASSPKAGKSAISPSPLTSV